MTLQVSRLDELADGVSDSHKHMVVTEISNQYFVKLAINSEPYPWHCHPNSDELLVVIEGTLIVETREGPKYELKQHDSVFIPRALVHRTLPIGRAVNLVVEKIDTETVFSADEDASEEN